MSAIETVVRVHAGNFPEAIEFEQASVLLFTASRDRTARFGTLGGAQHGGIWLDDAGFLARNFFQRMAEIGFVIEINLRDHRNFGDDDARRIKAAAHSDFVHREFHTGLREGIESDRGETFEKCRMRGKRARSYREFDDLADALE